MSNYDSVTSESLDSLLLLIKRCLCQGHASFPAFCMCIVWLYEYCVCKSYMYLYNVNVLKNAVATATTIKSVLKDMGIDGSAIANLFMRTRNSIAHGSVRNLKSMMIPALMHDIEFQSMLCKLGVDDEICTALIEFDNYDNFNALTYLTCRLSDKVRYLPTASIQDCKTIADCEALLDSVKHLL